MKKIKHLIVSLMLMTLITAVIVIAQPNTDRVLATNDKLGTTLIIPAHAMQVADNVFSLGTAIDKGRIVEGFMFIDKKKEHGKPGTECGNGICEPGENANKCPADCGSNGDTEKSSCFSLMAKGARWKTTEQYITDSGISTTLTATALDTWDSEVLFDIFGIRDETGTTDGADTVSPDGKNEVMFENLGSTSTIAYAIVWGIFFGPPNQRELVEWDVVFNSDYAFGDANIDSTAMDFQGTATHEFGHALGLSHPSDSCTEETMYRFINFGETKKRDLNAGDITGVNKIYS